MHVTVTNPDAPFDSPAYDGPADQAHRFLIAGNYPCSVEQYNGEITSGTLIVSAASSYLVPDHATTEYWTNAYGDDYGTLPAASDVKVGAEIMLIPGTSYTCEDTSGYEPDDEMPAPGTVIDASDVDDDRAAYGEVMAVKLVGDRIHLTIADYPAPAWTFSIPAAMPVYLAI